MNAQTSAATNWERRGVLAAAQLSRETRWALWDAQIKAGWRV